MAARLMDAIRNHSATPWTSGLTPTFFNTFTESPEPIRNRVSVRLFFAAMTIPVVNPSGIGRLLGAAGGEHRRQGEGKQQSEMICSHSDPLVSIARNYDSALNQPPQVVYYPVVICYKRGRFERAAAESVGT